MSDEADTVRPATSPERGRLGWIIVYVPSVEDALAFYERAFGVPRKFIAEGGVFGELDSGPTTLAFASEELAGSNLAHGFQRAAPDAPPCNIELCLLFDDVAAAFAHAVASIRRERAGRPRRQAVGADRRLRARPLRHARRAGIATRLRTRPPNRHPGRATPEPPLRA